MKIQQMLFCSVIVMSKEFSDFLDSMPEASMFSSVNLKHKVLKGAKTVFCANSEEEVIENFPSIVAKLTNIENICVKAIRMTVSCQKCRKCFEKIEKNYEKPILTCPINQPATKSVYSVDIKKYLSNAVAT